MHLNLEHQKAEYQGRCRMSWSEFSINTEAAKPIRSGNAHVRSDATATDAVVMMLVTWRIASTTPVSNRAHLHTIQPTCFDDVVFYVTQWCRAFNTEQAIALKPRPHQRQCRQKRRHCRRNRRHCRQKPRHCRQRRQQYRSYFVEATACLQPRRHATPKSTKVWVWGLKFSVASKGRTLIRVWGTVSQKLNHFDMCIALSCP